MTRIPLLLVAAALSMPATAADKRISAGEAAAMLATDFCGALVGEWPLDIPRVAGTIPGLAVSGPLATSQVPEPFRTQFKSELAGEPYALFHTLSFDVMKAKSGVVLGIIKRDGTLCQVTTLNARDTIASLEIRLESGLRLAVRPRPSRSLALSPPSQFGPRRGHACTCQARA